MGQCGRSDAGRLTRLRWPAYGAPWAARRWRPVAVATRSVPASPPTPSVPPATGFQTTPDLSRLLIGSAGSDELALWDLATEVLFVFAADDGKVTVWIAMGGTFSTPSTSGGWHPEPFTGWTTVRSRDGAHIGSVNRDGSRITAADAAYWFSPANDAPMSHIEVATGSQVNLWITRLPEWLPGSKKREKPALRISGGSWGDGGE